MSFARLPRSGVRQRQSHAAIRQRPMRILSRPRRRTHQGADRRKLQDAAEKPELPGLPRPRQQSRLRLREVLAGHRAQELVRARGRHAGKSARQKAPRRQAASEEALISGWWLVVGGWFRIDPDQPPTTNHQPPTYEQPAQNAADDAPPFG